MPHRVLVVDDEESIRALIEEFLQGRGYRVITAGDGEAGIQAFRRSRPHLAIIDFLLPRKNGFAVAEAIRTHTERATTPIIMMSGVFKNPKTAVEAREKYQVVDFLSKPLDLEQLSRLVAKTLDGVLPDEDDEEPSLELQMSPEPRSAPAKGSFEVLGGATQDDAGRPPPRGLSYYGGGAPKADPRAVQTREPSAVSGVIKDGVFVGRPFPELVEEGTVDLLPVALLLSAIRYDRTTGMLDLTDQATHRRIYIIRGHPTFMQSNAEGENVGALLLRRGRITEPDFERCLRFMKDNGRTLQQSLLELRLVTENDLATAYKLLAGQLLPLALGMAGGTYRWRETDAFVGRVPEGKFEPVAVLFDGIKRHVHPPHILKFFKAREDVPLVRTQEFDKLMPFFRRAFSAANIGAKIDGTATYRSITRENQADAATVIPQIFALVTSGMTVLPEVNASNAMEVAVNFAAAEVVDGFSSREDSGIDLGLEDDGGSSDSDQTARRARAAIDHYYDEIMSQDFFRMFRVDRDAPEDQVKSLYFELAKKWHTDSFSGLELGSSKRKLEEIFARITEAYETIAHKQKREEYIIYLDRRAKGLPTDVNEILRGEQLYDQALAMLRRRDFAGAKSVLDEAVRLNPDPLYYATLGWATFNVNQRSQAHVTEAVQLLKRAIKEQENLPTAYQFLGQICFVRGQYPEAKKWWTRCLEWEPNNIEAARGIRMVNSRSGDGGPGAGGGGAKPGILNKLRTKK